MFVAAECAPVCTLHRGVLFPRPRPAARTDRAGVAVLGTGGRARALTGCRGVLLAPPAHAMPHLIPGQYHSGPALGRRRGEGVKVHVSYRVRGRTTGATAGGNHGGSAVTASLAVPVSPVWTGCSTSSRRPGLVQDRSVPRADGGAGPGACAAFGSGPPVRARRAILFLRGHRWRRQDARLGRTHNHLAYAERCFGSHVIICEGEARRGSTQAGEPCLVAAAMLLLPPSS